MRFSRDYPDIKTLDFYSIMETKNILDDHLDEFRKIIDGMVTEKLDYLGYNLCDRQWENLEYHILRDELNKDRFRQSGIQKELESIRDDVVDEFRDATRFHFGIRRLREEGYHPRFFDSRYIDFIAYQGKLEVTDIEYTFNLPEPPEACKDLVGFEDWDKYMRIDWDATIYIISHENGECIVILREDDIDSEILRAHPWMEGITFTKMNEDDVIDFFDRNKDVPVKYKF